MTHVYLDWNVFDRIEKKERLESAQKEIYSFIEKLILEKQIITPYSNAHINDLIRGYDKNSNFITGHLKKLQQLTNDLCIVQYWGQDKTTWHHRDVFEFFYSALEDREITEKPFTEILNWDTTGTWKECLTVLDSATLPPNFIEIYKANEIFGLMFSKTKDRMNLLSLCEDIYNFYNNSRKDFSIYKSLRGYVNKFTSMLKNQQKLIKEIENNTSDIPNYLNIDEILDSYTPKTKVSENLEYQKIIETYCKIDFKGYKSDEKFSNLIDDSLHVYYGAQCDCFVTNDDKCHYKAAETYHKLGIYKPVLKPNEFAKNFTLFLHNKNS